MVNSFQTVFDSTTLKPTSTFVVPVNHSPTQILFHRYIGACKIRVGGISPSADLYTSKMYLNILDTSGSISQ